MGETNTAPGTATKPSEAISVSTSFFEGGGDEWMDQARASGIELISSWGRDGWDLGQWPYAIIGERQSGWTWEVIEYTEGDIRTSLFTDQAAAHRHIDTLAAWFWRSRGNGPAHPHDGIGPYRPR